MNIRALLLLLVVAIFVASNLTVTAPAQNPPLQIVDYSHCCMLSPARSFQVNLEMLRDHINAGKGVIYTKKAGFIDLGHLRYCVYLTKYVYDQIKKINGSPGEVVTRTGNALEGRATILQPVPKEMWVKVARSIGFDSSVAYEIETWNMYYPDYYTCHNSSFSPEDLPSNYLGTYVAETAINRSNSKFDCAVVDVTEEMILSFEPQDLDQTQAMFRQINGYWINFKTDKSYEDNRYLKRRNFDFRPPKWWDAEHGTIRALPESITGLGNADQYYSYIYSMSRLRISNKELANKIREIRQQSKQKEKYGEKADSPEYK